MRSFKKQIKNLLKAIEGGSINQGSALQVEDLDLSKWFRQDPYFLAKTPEEKALAKLLYDVPEPLPPSSGGRSYRQ